MIYILVTEDSEPAFTSSTKEGVINFVEDKMFDFKDPQEKSTRKQLIKRVFETFIPYKIEIDKDYTIEGESCGSTSKRLKSEYFFPELKKTSKAV